MAAAVALAAAIVGLVGMAGASAAVGGVRCRARQLRVSLGRSGVAAGSANQVVTFTNVSALACTLHGFPRLRMLRGGGRPIPTHVHRGTSVVVPVVPRRVVRLARGAHASFLAGWEDGTGFVGVRCPQASRVRVTAPGDRRATTIAWRLRPYGGHRIQTPTCGQITVSPLYRGAGRPR